MNDSEARVLAQHMGHDYNIHVKHYAIQTSLLERSKVAKVLCAINKGALSAPGTKTELSSLITKDSDVFDDDQPDGNICLS